MKRQIIFCVAVVTAIVVGVVFLTRQKNASLPIHTESSLRITVTPHMSTTTPDSQPAIAIVPHHLVAAELISETLARAAAYSAAHNAPVKRIILLAPNHFELGDAKIYTSRADWQTQDGVVLADTQFIEKTIHAGFARDDFFITGHDHGVFHLMPFIKNIFPEARVTPLLMRHQISRLEAAELTKFLRAELEPQDLVIISADFTHYLSESIMFAHDIGTINALYNLDEAYARETMDVDTPPSIVVAMQFARAAGAQKFVLTRRTSSVHYLQRNEPPDTTSYVSGLYVVGEKTPPPNTKTILYLPPQARAAPGLQSLRHGFMSVTAAAPPRALQNKNFAVGEIRTGAQSTWYLYPIEQIGAHDWRLKPLTSAERAAIENETGLSL